MGAQKNDVGPTTQVIAGCPFFADLRSWRSRNAECKVKHLSVDAYSVSAKYKHSVWVRICAFFSYAHSSQEAFAGVEAAAGDVVFIE